VLVLVGCGYGGEDLGEEEDWMGMGMEMGRLTGRRSRLFRSPWLLGDCAKWGLGNIREWRILAVWSTGFLLVSFEICCGLRGWTERLEQ